jgi:hypothetical protein
MRRSVLISLTFLVACSLAAPVRDPMELPADHVNEFVLVWEDAWLYTDRSEQAQRAREVVEPVRDADHLGKVRVFRYRGVAGNWVEVETLVGRIADRHCASTTPGLSNLRIRLYVKRADLAPVVKRDSFTEYDDGSAIELAAGVPVSEPRKESGGRAIYTVQTDAFRLATGLSVDSVGLAYVPSPHFSMVRTGQMVKGDLPLTFGGGARLAPLTAAAAYSVYDSKPAGAATLVTLHSNCGQYVVAVTPQDVLAEDAPPVSPVPPLAPIGQGLHARTNAIAYWPTGAAAGYAATDEPLGQEVEGSGPRRCFLALLNGKPQPPIETTLRICFDPLDVVAPVPLGVVKP